MQDTDSYPGDEVSEVRFKLRAILGASAFEIRRVTFGDDAQWQRRDFRG